MEEMTLHVYLKAYSDELEFLSAVRAALDVMRREGLTHRSAYARLKSLLERNEASFQGANGVLLEG